MVLDGPLLTQNAALSTVALVVTGALVWKLIRYARMRVALLPVSNIPGPSSQSFLLGNIKQLIARDALDFHMQVALNYGPVVKVHGFFGEPIIYVSDTKALHTILIKDEIDFREGDDFIGINKIVFGPCLISTIGPHHGKQRKMLNPVFSVSHMRDMLPLFYEVSNKFRQAIDECVVDGKSEIDMHAWFSRVALELVGQGILGYSFDSLVTDRPDLYGEALKSLVPETNQTLLLRMLTITTTDWLPNWLRGVPLKLFPAGTRVHRLVNVVNTLDTRSREIYVDKKRAMEEGDILKQVGRGNDAISILLRANAAAKEKDKLPEEEVIAQISMFIIAGLDTTSNTLSRIFSVLAAHPEHQDTLREELINAHAAEDLPYDELHRLPFLDSVIRETLRLYPPAQVLARIANRDTVIPLSKPVYTTDGKRLDMIPVPKGSQYLAGLNGCNVDKAIWGEDALEWKPDRWLSPPPSVVTQSPIPGVYSNLMSFSGGKRSCVGFKFAEMEMKVVLSMMISSFEFARSSNHIEWNFGTVVYPTVGKESNKPELPLIVRLYEPETRIMEK